MTFSTLKEAAQGFSENWNGFLREMKYRSSLRFVSYQVEEALV